MLVGQVFDTKRYGTIQYDLYESIQRTLLMKKSYVIPMNYLHHINNNNTRIQNQLCSS